MHEETGGQAAPPPLYPPYAYEIDRMPQQREPDSPSILTDHSNSNKMDKISKLLLICISILMLVIAYLIYTIQGLNAQLYEGKIDTGVAKLNPVTHSSKYEIPISNKQETQMSNFFRALYTSIDFQSGTTLSSTCESLQSAEIYSTEFTKNCIPHFLSSNGASLDIWNKEWHKIFSLPCYERSEVSDIAYLTTGHIAVSGGKGDIKIWSLSLEERKSIMTLHGHRSRINGVLEMPSGYLVSGSSDGSLKVWNVKYGNEVRTLGATGSVQVLMRDHLGRVWSGDYNKNVIIWDMVKYTKVNILKQRGAVFGIVLLGHGGKTAVITDSETESITIYTPNLLLVTTLSTKIQAQTAIRLNNGLLIIAGRRGIIQKWDLINKKKLKTYHPVSDTIFKLVELEEDLIVCGTISGYFFLFDMNKEVIVKKIDSKGSSRVLAKIE